MKNTVKLVDSNQTMDSREIAELTGKRHDNVLRDIEAMLPQSNANGLSFEAVYKGGNGEERKCYKLPYRETMILVSGYSVELRSRIIDRWMELERKEASRKRIHEESKKARNDLTEQWKEHGADKFYHYINLTKAEYLSIFGSRDKKKVDMTAEEIGILRVFESIESLKLNCNQSIQGYHSLADSIAETGKQLPSIVENIIQRRISA